MPIRDEPPVADEAHGGIVREPECRTLTGLSRATRWRLERTGQFPKRRKLSSNTIGWLRSELLAWIASRGKLGAA